MLPRYLLNLSSLHRTIKHLKSTNAIPSIQLIQSSRTNPHINCLNILRLVKEYPEVNHVIKFSNVGFDMVNIFAIFSAARCVHSTLTISMENSGENNILKDKLCNNLSNTFTDVTMFKTYEISDKYSLTKLLHEITNTHIDSSINIVSKCYYSYPIPGGVCTYIPEMRHIPIIDIH